MASGGPDWLPMYWVLKQLIDAKLGSIDTHISDQLNLVQTTIQNVLNAINQNTADQLSTLQTTIQNTLNDIALNTQEQMRTSLLQLGDVLASAFPVDLSGRIFAYDSFESGMGEWSYTGTGTYNFHPTRRTRKTGEQALRLYVGGTSSNNLYLKRLFPIPKGPRIGLQISYCPTSIYGNFRFGCIICTPASTRQYSMRLDPQLGAVEVWDDSANWKTLGYITIQDRGGAWWHTLKFVFDKTTYQYLKAVVDGIEFDPTLWHGDGISTVNTGMTVTLSYTGTVPSGGACECFLDDFLVTDEG